MCWGFDPAVIGTVAEWIVAPLCVVLGALAAFKYQNLSKKKEFQFGYIEKVAAATREMSAITFDYLLCVATLSIAENPKAAFKAKKPIAELKEEAEKAERLLHNAILLKAHTLAAVMTLLFSEKTQSYWTEILLCFQGIPGKRLPARQIREAMRKAENSFWCFVSEAGRETGLKMRQPALGGYGVTDEERQQIDELLELSDPQEEQGREGSTKGPESEHGKGGGSE